MYICVWMRPCACQHICPSFFPVLVFRYSWGTKQNDIELINALCKYGTLLSQSLGREGIGRRRSLNCLVFLWTANVCVNSALSPRFLNIALDTRVNMPTSFTTSVSGIKALSTQWNNVARFRCCRLETMQTFSFLRYLCFEIARLLCFKKKMHINWKSYVKKKALYIVCNKSRSEWMRT